MALISLRQFRGALKRPDPLLLDPAFGTEFINGRTFRGVLTPLEGLAYVGQMTKLSGVKTIYRFGQDVVTPDTQHWFNWLTDVDVVRGPIAGDVSERSYFTGDGVPKVTDNSIALGADLPNASYALGLPAPAATMSATVGGTGTGTAETRVYVVTYVSAWGEEGPPSLATASVSIQPGQSLTLNNIPTAPAGNYNVATKRIYRSVLGSASVEYLFVKEIPVATTSTTDTVAAANLGEVLPSLGWLAPPQNLSGLVAMPNGMMAGFVGRDIYFCEPFRPHAWPLKYVLTADHPVVGLGVVDTTLVVLTTGTPYYVQGAHPDSMVMVRAPVHQACVSKRSIVSAFGGVMYASPDGLMFLTPGAEPRNLTDQVFAPGQWQAIKPSSINGYLFEGYYVGFYDTGTVQAGFMVSLSGDWTSLNFYAAAGYNDIKQDTLYLFATESGTTGLYKFAKAATTRTMTWASKEFYLAGQGLSVMKIDAASYPVTLSIYLDGIDTIGKIVNSAAPFRLFSFRADRIRFEVTSAYEVRSIVAASSVDELRRG